MYRSKPVFTGVVIGAFVQGYVFFSSAEKFINIEEIWNFEELSPVSFHFNFTICVGGLGSITWDFRRCIMTFDGQHESFQVVFLDVHWSIRLLLIFLHIAAAKIKF